MFMYLLWKCQNEFIELRTKKVKDVILEEIKESYYYDLIVDGTPDVSHTEQLTFIIRYLLWRDGYWKVYERFIQVQDCEKKRGMDIAEVIIQVLAENEIDLDKLRGQACDNGSNMAANLRVFKPLFL